MPSARKLDRSRSTSSPIAADPAAGLIDGSVSDSSAASWPCASSAAFCRAVCARSAASRNASDSRWRDMSCTAIVKSSENGGRQGFSLTYATRRQGVHRRALRPLREGFAASSA
jgi:hypothetical protein